MLFPNPWALPSIFQVLWTAKLHIWIQILCRYNLVDLELPKSLLLFGRFYKRYEHHPVEIFSLLSNLIEHLSVSFDEELRNQPFLLAIIDRSIEFDQRLNSDLGSSWVLILVTLPHLWRKRYFLYIWSNAHSFSKVRNCKDWEKLLIYTLEYCIKIALAKLNDCK